MVVADEAAAAVLIRLAAAPARAPQRRHPKHGGVARIYVYISIDGYVPIYS